MFKKKGTATKIRKTKGTQLTAGCPFGGEKTKKTGRRPEPRVFWNGFGLEKDEFDGWDPGAKSKGTSACQALGTLSGDWLSLLL